MSELTDRIEELELIEVRYRMLRLKIKSELGDFVAHWDSPDREKLLPVSDFYRISYVRSVLNFVGEVIE